MTNAVAATQAKHRDEDDRQLADDVRAVMATEPGQRLFAAMLHKGGVYRFSKPDDNLAYHAGRRDAVLEVMTAVNRYSPAMAALAVKQRNAQVAERVAALEEAQKKDTDNRKRPFQ